MSKIRWENKFFLEQKFVVLTAYVTSYKQNIYKK